MPKFFGRAAIWVVVLAFAVGDVSLWAQEKRDGARPEHTGAVLPGRARGGADGLQGRGILRRRRADAADRADRRLWQRQGLRRCLILGTCAGLFGLG